MRLHYYDGCVVWYVYSDVWLVCMDTSGSVLATGPNPLSHVHGIIVYSIPARERYTRKNRKVSPPPPQKHKNNTHEHKTLQNTTWEQDPGCPALRTGAVG